MACFGKADCVERGRIKQSKIVGSLAHIVWRSLGRIIGLKVGRSETLLVARDRRNMIDKWYP